MTMKSKSNGNLSVDERVRQKKGKEREFLMQCCHSILNVCVVFLSPYSSITISLIHSYGFAVCASKIMFA